MYIIEGLILANPNLIYYNLYVELTLSEALSCSVKSFPELASCQSVYNQYCMMHFRAYLPLLLQLVDASHPLDSPGWLPGLTAFAVVSFSLTYNTIKCFALLFCRPYRIRTYISLHNSSNPMSRIYV